jgi:acyl carrier protein
MELEKEIIGYIKKLNKGSPTDLNTTTPLISEAILDSLGIIEVISFLEEKYHLNFDDSDLVQENFESVKSIMALVNKKKRL